MRLIHHVKTLTASALCLAGCTDGTDAKRVELTEFQYHWLRGCQAVLWVYKSKERDDVIARAEALHRLGCETATRAQIDAALDINAATSATGR